MARPGGPGSALLLDTDLEANRKTPQHHRPLYVPNRTAGCARRSCSASAGFVPTRARRRLGRVPPQRRHSFLCAIERIRELRASRQMTLEEARLVARAGIVFTTHTPSRRAATISTPASSGICSGRTSVRSESRRPLHGPGRQRPGDPRERLCTTYAALRLADQSVGVSRFTERFRDDWEGRLARPARNASSDRFGHQRRAHAHLVAPEIATLLSR